MAVQVQPRQKKQYGIGDLLQVGGAIAGGVVGSAGGAQGALMGAGAGSSLGGLAGGVIENQMESPQQAALQRRMGSAAPQAGGVPTVDDQLNQLQAARFELAKQPEDVQKQYAPTIMNAMYKLQRGQA